MRWDALQLRGKADGSLIYAMDQGQSAVTTQPGPWGTATTGYCAGLVLFWMSRSYAGGDLPYDAASKEMNDVVWQATAIQNGIDDLTAVTEPSGWYKAALQTLQMGLSKGNRAQRGKGPNGSFLRAVADNAYGCYVVHLISPTSAHCIGMRHARDGKFHLFDANYGHFAKQGPDAFQSFLDWYMGASGYGARYSKLTWVCGVTPPI